MGKLIRLRKLHLNLDATWVEVEQLGVELGHLSYLTTLRVNIFGTTVANVDQLGEALGQLRRLTTLTIEFQSTSLTMSCIC